ncbi:MAG TPA: hypothetical protein VK811_03020 [Candidatus Acidoferrum sp.]|jgi:hypothetical protein|nr:hypothetical protein [Candidatus Acidoferrum sp.]
MSIPGSNRPPYRAPCEGTALCGNGPRYQNSKASEKNIPVWLYNGTVPNWDGCPSQAETTTPYERPNPIYVDQETDNCGGGETTYQQPSGPWMGICQLDGDYAPCATDTMPASGTTSEIFDLANPAPDSWYQPQMLTGATIANGGENYQVGDLLDLNGGTVSNYIIPPGGIASLTAYIAVSAVNGSGAIAALTIPNAGSYQTIPLSPNAVTGGHGTGASITLSFGNQMKSLAQCKKIGYKNVQGMRQWHGQPGWLWSGAPDVYTCPSDDDGNFCNWTFFHDYSSTAPQSKYCSAEIDIDFSSGGWTGSEFYTTCTDSFSIDVSVNPQSGVCTVNSLSPGTGDAFSYSVPFGGSGASSNAYNLLANDAMEMVQGLVATMLALFTPTGGPNNTVSCETDGATWSWSYGPGDYGQTFTMSWTLGDTVSFSGSYSDIYGQGETFSGSVSDDTFYFTYGLNNDVESGYPAGYETINYTLTASLGSANAASAVLADITTLLAEWPLTDDALYPWRSDANTSIAPVVSRNEVPGNISPLFFGVATSATEINDCQGNAPGSPDYTTTYELVAQTDPNSFLYDGTIRGAPKPAGYQGAFYFGWLDYQNAGDIDGLPDYEIFGWGEKNTGQYGIPLNATQWTNFQQGIQFPGGAWLFYNCNPSVSGNGECFGPGAGCPQPGAVLMAQKWAETKVPLPSQNFFRPAGNDRFVYDEENVYAIGSTSGGPGAGTQINLVDTIHCDATTSVVASGLWGPYQNTDGKWYFWSVTGGGASLTLSAPVYLLPDNWQSASGDGSASDPSTIACLGKLRWSTGNPATDPFPILGRAGVSAVAEYESEADVTELTTDSLPNLGLCQTSGSYDLVDVYDKTMTIITGSLDVTRIDDSHFTVPVAVATLANAAWVQSHGAPAYYWDDQYPKGDYVYTDWTYWPRQVYEPTRINGIYNSCNGAACGDTNVTSCVCSSITCETSAANVFSTFTQEAGCVPFTPCNPAVLAITPNGETFANGATYDFPAINLDEIYGSGWQAEFQQAMTDLLWQPPHVPATSPCAAETTAWTEDNGTCESNSDTNTYYAHRPLVEARLTVPAGAPALPSGITIGWLSPVTNPTSPDALYPAPSNGPGLGGNVPWTILDNECGCIQGDGVFTGIYENQVVTCD